MANTSLGVHLFQYVRSASCDWLNQKPRKACGCWSPIR